MPWGCTHAVATMIHIITTCGNDSNQKLKWTQQIIWRGLTAKQQIIHSTAVRAQATVRCFAYSSGKSLRIYGCPIGHNIQGQKAQGLWETHWKSTHTLNMKIETKTCNMRGNVGTTSSSIRLSAWSETLVIPWVLLQFLLLRFKKDTKRLYVHV